MAEKAERQYVVATKSKDHEEGDQRIIVIEPSTRGKDHEEGDQPIIFIEPSAHDKGTGPVTVDLRMDDRFISDDSPVLSDNLWRITWTHRTSA